MAGSLYIMYSDFFKLKKKTNFGFSKFSTKKNIRRMNQFYKTNNIQSKPNSGKGQLEKVNKIIFIRQDVQ